MNDSGFHGMRMGWDRNAERYEILLGYGDRKVDCKRGTESASERQECKGYGQAEI